jgi:hypothetical protein
MRAPRRTASGGGGDGCLGGVCALMTLPIRLMILPISLFFKCMLLSMGLWVKLFFVWPCRCARKVFTWGYERNPKNTVLITTSLLVSLVTINILVSGDFGIASKVFAGIVLLSLLPLMLLIYRKWDGSGLPSPSHKKVSPPYRHPDDDSDSDAF